MGFTFETVCIQSGINSRGVRDVLINSNGNVRKDPKANTVSELPVFNPIVKEIPDHANPKKVMVKSMRSIPGIPVTGVAPRKKAKTMIMLDWIRTLKASLVSLPKRIAYLLTGVTSIFCRNPPSMSDTMEFPDWRALPKAFCNRIPGVAKRR